MKIQITVTAYHLEGKNRWRKICMAFIHNKYYTFILFEKTLITV